MRNLSAWKARLALLGQRLRTPRAGRTLLALGAMLGVLGAGVLWLLSGTSNAPARLPASPRPEQRQGAGLPIPSPGAIAPRPSPVASPVAAVEPPAATGQVYRVEPGDTLAGIAARHGLRTETLQRANALSQPDLLRPGQELRIPATDGDFYTLQPGDTLREVAERAGVPLADLLAANDLGDPDRVSAGTQILVPAATPEVPPSPAGTER